MRIRLPPRFPDAIGSATEGSQWSSSNRHRTLFPVAWLGFAINLLSGLMLYSSHATEYTFQSVFILKLGLLALGGILLKVLMVKIREGADPTVTKVIAAFSLASWVGAVITGRLMAYW